MNILKSLIKKIEHYASIPFILKDFIIFKKKIKRNREFTIYIRDFYPRISDKKTVTGFDRHYLYHTAWAVRKVKKINPVYHIDVGSSLYFCSLLSAFIPVEFYDYRPPLLKLDNLNVKQGDLISLPFKDNGVSSISCMHTVEHVGLGRYGDSIDPDGDLKAIKELKRVLAPGGSLLFVVPIGKPKIMFNAHRIYSYDQIREYFNNFHIEEFSLIPENEKNGDLIENATREMTDKEKYGCGCFWFKK